MWFTDKTWLKPVLATAIAGTLAGCASGPKVYDLGQHWHRPNNR